MPPVEDSRFLTCPGIRSAGGKFKRVAQFWTAPAFLDKSMKARSLVQAALDGVLAEVSTLTLSPKP